MYGCMTVIDIVFFSWTNIDCSSNVREQKINCTPENCKNHIIFDLFMLINFYARSIRTLKRLTAYRIQTDYFECYANVRLTLVQYSFETDNQAWSENHFLWKWFEITRQVFWTQNFWNFCDCQICKIFLLETNVFDFFF